MRRVSNNITLVLKLFLPTFWFVFFTSFLVAILLVDENNIPLLGSWQFRLAYVIVYLLFAFFLIFTVMKLLRVDFGEDKFHVSNYMKTYSYNYSDIHQIKEHNYVLFRLLVIHLKSKGSLGKKIMFIPSYRNFEFFVTNHPELFEQIEMS